MRKKIVVIIPARMAASRFPGKPLVRIMDLPMIEHVRRRVLLSDVVDDVCVATCDEVVMCAVEKHGGKAVMTADTHERCTERVEEAARGIEADIVVIVQGDEPLFMPEVIEKLVHPIVSDGNICCTNLLSLIRDRADLSDIDIVKSVLDQDQNVMYFSRSPVPYFRVNNDVPCYRQTGISAFTKGFLSKFTQLRPTPLEIAESVDFLRILEHGYKIKGVVIPQRTFGVDREDDVQIIENVIINDPIHNKYYKKIIER